MKKGRGMSKGSAFEREICKRLSLWWTDNKRDDIFWRTSGSGARAKTRSKTSQKTFGQYGDIQAVDPVGQPLMDLCTIELKRGYNTETLSDLIEGGKKKPRLLEFIEQASTDCRLRDDESEWILIVKRDRKEAVLFTPYSFFKDLTHRWRIKHNWKEIRPFELGSMLFRHKEQNHSRKTILICSLEWFLKRIKPEEVKWKNNIRQTQV